MGGAGLGSRSSFGAGCIGSRLVEAVDRRVGAQGSGVVAFVDRGGLSGAVSGLERPWRAARPAGFEVIGGHWRRGGPGRPSGKSRDSMPGPTEALSSGWSVSRGPEGHGLPTASSGRVKMTVWGGSGGGVDPGGALGQDCLVSASRIMVSSNAPRDLT